MTNRAWVQPPSFQLCVVECGARCCRAPGHVKLSLKEANRLALRLPQGVTVRETPGDPQRVTMNFSENGGQCPFLNADSACSIYDYRPVACHRFPMAPMADCFVWPLTDGGA